MKLSLQWGHDPEADFEERAKWVGISPTGELAERRARLSTSHRPPLVRPRDTILAADPDPRHPIPEADASPQTWIVNRPQKLQKLDCFRIEGLYRRFAVADRPETYVPRKPAREGVLDFVRTYGLLRNSREEQLWFIRDEMKAMRSVIDAADRHDWDALDGWLRKDETRRAIGVSATFYNAPGQERPDVFFKPRDLISAMYLQLLQDVTDGTELRKCARPGCLEWFTFGAGTGRRKTKLYCGPSCQKAHAYAKEEGSP
jgi:hypothetical protein